MADGRESAASIQDDELSAAAAPHLPAAAAAVAAAPAGWSGGSDVENPPSPTRIPAYKPSDQQERPVFQLHAWPAGLDLHTETAFDEGSQSAEPPPQPAAGWRRAWRRLASAAATVLPRRHSHSPPLEAVSRSGSVEVLQATGREQSAPYLPSKRPLHPQGPLAARRRWRLACQAVIDAQEVARCMELLSNRLAPAQDRLHAAVRLAARLQHYPQPQRPLAWALLAQLGRSRRRWGEHMLQELYMTGERIFAFFAPPAMGAHRPYFTCVAPAVLVLVWAFMAGQYAAYQAVAAPASLACLAAQHASGAAPAWGPRTLVRWIAPRQGEWCFGVSAGKFNARYMIDWGARWAPDMGSSPQRWLTSALLHQSFVHLLSNSLMLAGFSLQLERKHGTWRVAALAVLAALAGNLLSAVTEAPCTAVVGASGAVFGLSGATVADMLANFETLGRPVLRTAILLAFLIFFAVTVATTPSGTSHLSHVGGFLGGLACALVLLPNLHRSRAEAAATAAGALGALALFVALPCWFYLRQLPGITC